MQILTVKSPVDHTFAPLLASFVSARGTVAVSAVIQSNQATITALAVVKMASEIASATSGECIHHRADDCHPLVVITLLVELRMPTIPPQDIGDLETFGFRLR